MLSLNSGKTPVVIIEISIEMSNVFPGMQRGFTCTTRWNCVEIASTFVET